MDGFLGGPDPLQQYVEKRAVFQDLDRVAGHGGGERQAGHRCHELVDRRGALHMQSRVKVAADRPDDDQQEDDDADEGQWNQERRFAQEIDHRWIVLGRKSCRCNRHSFFGEWGSPAIPIDGGPATDARPLST